jgi:hypothetical protein
LGSSIAPWLMAFYAPRLFESFYWLINSFLLLFERVRQRPRLERLESFEPSLRS